MSDRSSKNRRQVFGAVLLLLAVVVLVVAMAGHVRRLSYVAYALGAAGVWMVSRRSNR
jgi:alpha-beta hydrolase superfamily lysophospholipase